MVRRTVIIFLYLILLFFGTCKVKEGALPKTNGEGGTPLLTKASQTPTSNPSSSNKVFPNQVAGMFYSPSPTELQNEVKQFIAGAKLKEELSDKDIVGVISPHAGYRFSGSVAGYSYRAIKGRRYSVVIILSFSHHQRTEKIATLDWDGYHTPLGDIPIEKSIVGELTTKYPKLIEVNPNPFRGEHSLEVQLPFIKEALPGAKIVPILVSTGREEDALELGDLLFKQFGKKKDILFVVSTDLSHYLSYEDAISVDKELVDIMAKVDLGAFMSKGRGEPYKGGYTGACGYFPVLTFLRFFSNYPQDRRKGVVLEYKNSGDTFGERGRVVGYGSIAFTVEKGIRDEMLSSLSNSKEEFKGKIHDSILVNSSDITKRPEYSFTLEEKELLLKIAKRSVEEAVIKGNTSYVPEKPDSERLGRLGAAFVTIKCNTDTSGRCQGKGDELRGCIGHVIATVPLYLCVAQVARAAAIEDPRFPKVTPEELPYLRYEISVLTAPEKVEDPNTIVVGRDGLIISKGGWRGLLLPQVPGEFGWNREQFLDATCRKAGLYPGCWKEEGTIIERFQAVVWGE